MVADSFTIAGTFGLAAGLTGFFASTVERAAGQLNTAKHAHQRLRGFQVTLKTCQRRLEAWAQQWYSHEEITKEDPLFLWGSEGLEDVEHIKLNILKEQDDLLKLLYGRSWSRTHGREAALRWESILQGQEDALRQNSPAPPAPSDDGSRDLCVRISTALCNNSLLSTSVDRLKRLVEDLETISRLRFHEAQKSVDHHKQPSKDEIGSFVKQYRRMEHLAQALSVAYQNLRPSAGSCELLFTNFDKVEICRLGAQSEWAVTFLIKNSPLTGPGSRYSYRRLDVRHPLDSAHGSIISDQARGMLQYELKANEVAARGHTMRGEFLHIDGLEKIQQDVHREDIRLDCMATAVCIGAWSMLTWRSWWLDGLSSCRIVQAHFGDGETWPAFAPDSCSPDCCTSCHSENRPYLLLAIILAELALACPISITFESEKTSFDVGNTKNSNQSVGRYISKSDLLDEINPATSWHYRSAVKYCLGQDASTCSRSGIMYRYNHAHFYKRVIEPLDRNYRPLRKHTEDHPELYKSFRQEAARFAA